MPHLVFGAGGIGTTESSFTFTWDTADKVRALLAALRRLGVTELDSAASYPPGNAWNTETLLGASRAAVAAADGGGGFALDTKVLVERGVAFLGGGRIAASLDRSLALLGVPRVRTLYAHANDGQTPLAEQLASFDAAYRQGKFERVGPAPPPPPSLSQEHADAG